MNFLQSGFLIWKYRGRSIVVLCIGGGRFQILFDPRTEKGSETLDFSKEELK
jgi:hypothetical protein